MNTSLHEVKIYHDTNSPRFSFLPENYLFSVWVDRSRPEYTNKTLTEIYSLLLVERGLAPDDFKTSGYGFIVLDSKLNKKLKLTKEDLRNLARNGYRWAYTETKQKKEVFIFQRQESNGYGVIKAFKKDLLDGNLFEMFELGLSR